MVLVAPTSPMSVNLLVPPLSKCSVMGTSLMVTLSPGPSFFHLSPTVCQLFHCSSLFHVFPSVHPSTGVSSFASASLNKSNLIFTHSLSHCHTCCHCISPAHGRPLLMVQWFPLWSGCGITHSIDFFFLLFLSDTQRNVSFSAYLSAESGATHV